MNGRSEWYTPQVVLAALGIDDEPEPEQDDDDTTDDWWDHPSLTASERNPNLR